MLHGLICKVLIQQNTCIKNTLPFDFGKYHDSKQVLSKVHNPNSLDLCRTEMLLCLQWLCCLDKCMPCGYCEAMHVCINGCYNG